jgi:hypothetical protein
MEQKAKRKSILFFVLLNKRNSGAPAAHTAAVRIAVRKLLRFFSVQR